MDAPYQIVKAKTEEYWVLMDTRHNKVIDHSEYREDLVEMRNKLNTDSFFKQMGM